MVDDIRPEHDQHDQHAAPGAVPARPAGTTGDAHGAHVARAADHEGEQLAGERVTPTRADTAGGAQGNNIVLNDARFADDPQGAAHITRILTQVSREARGRSEDDVADAVRSAFEREGVRVTDVEIDRFAEQIARKGEVAAVSADDGTVVAGDADPVALQNPPVGRHADPDDPERPAYA